VSVYTSERMAAVVHFPNGSSIRIYIQVFILISRYERATGRKLDYKGKEIDHRRMCVCV